MVENEHAMNNLRMTIFVLLMYSKCFENSFVQRCDPVPKYLRDLYQRLTITRNNSGMNKTAKLTITGKLKLVLFFRHSPKNTCKRFEAGVATGKRQSYFLQ